MNPSGGEVWRNVLDLYADMERYRAEHGPFLRELRCTTAVRLFLVALIGQSEPQPWVMPLARIPLIEDASIPAGALRLVYDDGTTKDEQVIKLPTIDDMRSRLDVLPYQIPFGETADAYMRGPVRFRTQPPANPSRRRRLKLHLPWRKKATDHA